MIISFPVADSAAIIQHAGRVAEYLAKRHDVRITNLDHLIDRKIIDDCQHARANDARLSDDIPEYEEIFREACIRRYLFLMQVQVSGKASKALERRKFGKPSKAVHKMAKRFEAAV